MVQKPLQDIVELVNNHFANICQTYPAMDNETPLDSSNNETKLELISEYYTYKLLNKFSKKSLGPNDFPRKILQEFSIFLALPFSDITNCVIKSGIFPDAYKISEIIPLPKEKKNSST